MYYTVNMHPPPVLTRLESRVARVRRGVRYDAVHLVASHPAGPVFLQQVQLLPARPAIHPFSQKCLGRDGTVLPHARQRKNHCIFVILYSIRELIFHSFLSSLWAARKEARVRLQNPWAADCGTFTVATGLSPPQRRQVRKLKDNNCTPLREEVPWVAKGPYDNVLNNRVRQEAVCTSCLTRQIGQYTSRVM